MCQVSSVTLRGKSVKLPTNICNPIMVSMLSFEDLRTTMVAIAKAMTPTIQKHVPIMSKSSVVLFDMTRTIPNSPNHKPKKPDLFIRSLRKTHENAATTSGRELAMIAAWLASIHCIETKFKPK